MIVKTETEHILNYFKDAGNFPGNIDCVYIPENTNELIECVYNCCSKNIQFTISGSRTSVTGSATPMSGALISTEKLNKIISIDPINKIAAIEPGVTLEELELELNAYNCFYPPNPTEKKATLGGNVSTNASGARTFKYGSTRIWISSLKIILTDGEILHLKRGESFASKYLLKLKSLNGKIYDVRLPEITIPQTKHSAGYFISENMDSIDLFIGSEGTLGVIQEIELKFLEQPEKIIGGIIFFDEIEKMLDMVEDLQFKSKQPLSNIQVAVPDDKEKLISNKPTHMLGIETRVIEFFDKNSLDLLKKHYSQIPGNSSAAIWFEQECRTSDEDDLLSLWYEFIKLYTKLSDKTWIATSESEHRKLAGFRHTLPLEVNDFFSRHGQKKLATDTAVPDGKLKEFFEVIFKEVRKSKLPYVVFGHIGNNHLHANLFPENDSEYSIGRVFYNNVVEETLKLGGTISAEHGVGKMKKSELMRMYGKEAIKKMIDVKKTLDEKLLLGIGNVFDI